MAEARGRAAWDHTAALLALLVNVNRDPKRSKPAAPADFHPYAVKPEPVAVPLSAIRPLFVGPTAPTAEPPP